MSRGWIRWRLLALCGAAGAILPLVILGEALLNIHRLRSESGSPEARQMAQRLGAYLQGATFSANTLVPLALMALEIAVLLYGISLAVVYLRNWLEREQRG